MTDKTKGQTVAAEADVDACIFFSSENRPSHSMKRLIGIAGDGSALLTFKRKEPLYLHPPLEAPPTIKNVTVRRRARGSITKTLKRMKATRIGLDYDELSKKDFDRLTRQLQSELETVTFKDVSELVRKRRLVKTDKELKHLREAIRRTERILEEVIEQIPNMTRESEAIAYLKKRTIEHDDELSFEPIVASGRQSRNPHYQPSEQSKLKKGFCIIDFGVKHKGYCADITRTIYIGNPEAKDIEFYNKVKNEQQRLETTLKTGIKEAKPTFEMIHALGHGIGLEVHEQPLLGHERLQDGMTVALEPALYDKQGVRIEDDYVVTDKGLKRLSRGSRKLKHVRR